MTVAAGSPIAPEPSTFRSLRVLEVDSRFVVADGTLELLKWVALVLMVADHINKYFFAEQLPGVFSLGRIVMPIFGFILVYNLARPEALRRGVHQRVMKRLSLVGLATTPIYIALNGFVAKSQPWWPLNIMWTLLLTTAIIYLIEKRKARYLLSAALLFVLAGAFVEYLWLGVIACLGAWMFCRVPSIKGLILWFLGVLPLTLINVNAWALAAIPVILVASKSDVRLPRNKSIFYVFYPLHLGIILAVKEML